MGSIREYKSINSKNAVVAGTITTLITVTVSCQNEIVLIIYEGSITTRALC